jgi:hypothetical protein
MDSVGVLFDFFERFWPLIVGECFSKALFVYPVVFFERFWYLIVGEF